MGLKAGIVGLPNVGKSTLFNALAKANVEAANYPFATINPNTGVVAVPDKRVTALSNLFKPDRTIFTTIEFIDIAGLVKGASKGEGLGNQFLGHIRECDAIVEVVRVFSDPNIIHVETTIDPLRDIEIINLELVFADLDSVNRRLDRVGTKAKTSKDPQAVLEVEALTKAKLLLDAGLPARSGNYSKFEGDFLHKEMHLLTMKPIIYVANVGADERAGIEETSAYQELNSYALNHKAVIIPISCEIEAQIASLDPVEQNEFLASIGATMSGLDLLVMATYKLLNLGTFFTVGADECRAWTFNHGMRAPQCAGVIHSDFERGFIKAEVYHYDDIIKYRSELALKEAGKIRLEGKDYIVKDGDVMFFKFNV